MIIVEKVTVHAGKENGQGYLMVDSHAAEVTVTVVVRDSTQPGRWGGNTVCELVLTRKQADEVKKWL